MCGGDQIMDKFVTRSKRPARSPVKARLSKKARGEPEEEKKRPKTCCEDEEDAGRLDDERERSGEKQQEKEEDKDEDDDVEWESPEGFSAPIPWRKIEAEGLDCDYGLLFKKAKATELFHKLEREVEYFTGEQTKVQVFGKSYSVPRKQATYGDEGLMYSFSGVHLLARPWTPTLEGIRDAVTTATGHTFNFVLINRYKDGLDHMGEHRDDERELDPSCPIASVSLGAARDFVFRPRSSRGTWGAGSGSSRGGGGSSGRGGGGGGGAAAKKCGGGGGGGVGGSSSSPPVPVKLELAHGSLLLMNAPTNTYWYHSLPVRKKCLAPRINLTFRGILKKP